MSARNHVVRIVVVMLIGLATVVLPGVGSAAAQPSGSSIIIPRGPIAPRYPDPLRAFFAALGVPDCPSPVPICVYY
ncbi:hypothetical protein [Millisia brevis]|uniref:hypothetical protein n=1 Tax=Millisia brevis TaxID=264148 RepID=UPI0012ED439A|nr:hypothetical protein [Millisia brevis]